MGNEHADKMQVEHNASLAIGDFLSLDDPRLIEAERQAVYWQKIAARRLGKLDKVRRSRADNAKGVIHYAEKAERLETALRAIIARADTDKPGTSKVQDMRRLAVEALGE